MDFLTMTGGPRSDRFIDDTVRTPRLEPWIDWRHDGVYLVVGADRYLLSAEDIERLRIGLR